jgi:hypothetical protein
MFTLKPTDTKSGRYAIGTYELGQDAATGSGIRNYPYSFDLGVDPLTYRTLSSSNNLYDRGQVWGSALMDLTWLLIEKYGYRSDWQHGYEAANPARNGGNNLAMKLVMDALKLQPANPSFLAGRDAILAADAALTGGANALAIWTAFARRGMGYLASSLGTSNDTQISESFDLPPTLILPKIVSQVPNANSAISAPVSQIDFSFLESMDPSSFSIADDVVSFVSPSGADLKSQITGFTWLDSSLKLRIYFNSQSADGLYQMVIGPNILAADDHSPMDQDGDHVAGEAGDDAYTAKLRIDTLPLAVVNTTPANGSLVTLPLTSLDIGFNEPIDPASLQTTDLTISRGSVSGVCALESNTA